MPIGVFDSGLGGLTVLRGLRAGMPNQSFVYLGDNAAAPYGARPAGEVRALTEKAVERLFAEGCELVIIACNTACALALRPLQQQWLPNRARNNRVLGVFAPIIEAITARDWAETLDAEAAPVAASDRGAGRRVVVFATPATAESGAFEREAARRAPALSVHVVACPGLVDAIEGGDRAGVARAVYAAAAQWPRGGAADGSDATVVLGCTHYPLAEAAFRAALPPAAAILDQPSVSAASLARYLTRHARFEDRAGALRCLTTGDPKTVSDRAALYFGARLGFERA